MNLVISQYQYNSGEEEYENLCKLNKYELSEP